MKHLTITLLITGICLAGDSDFESMGYARGAAEYLKLPRHSHSAGLSGAVVAWQEELTGFQYNPAILDITTPVMERTIKDEDWNYYNVQAADFVWAYANTEDAVIVVSPGSA